MESLSLEAQFVIKLLQKKVCDKQVDCEVMIELEDYENEMTDEIMKCALQELEKQGYIKIMNFFIDGSFYIAIRSKGENAILCLAPQQITQTDSGLAFTPKELVVLAEYPQFQKDYIKLIEYGYMTKTNEGLKWLKSKTSLTEYFASLSCKKNNWHIIENLFNQTGLSNIYKNITSRSKDFAKLKSIL